MKSETIFWLCVGLFIFCCLLAVVAVWAYKHYFPKTMAKKVKVHVPVCPVCKKSNAGAWDKMPTLLKRPWEFTFIYFHVRGLWEVTRGELHICEKCYENINADIQAKLMNIHVQNAKHEEALMRDLNTYYRKILNEKENRHGKSSLSRSTVLRSRSVHKDV